MGNSLRMLLGAALLLSVAVLISMFSYQVIAASNVALYGKFTDSSNAPLQSNIVLYNPGTSVVNSSGSTDAQGSYAISTLPGSYDVQYTVPSFFIPNFFAKINSVNIRSDLVNLVNNLNNIGSQNLSFVANISENKIIQTLSPSKPVRVLVNKNQISEVSSLSSLTSGTWFYDSAAQNLYISAGTPQGLVGYWKFDEGSGTTAADSSGYGNNGRLVNGPTWTTGQFGNALQFDGTNDFVRVNNVPVNTASGGYNTVEFWMYWTGTQSQMPFSWNPSTNAYNLWLSDSNEFGFNTYANEVYGIPGATSKLANKWVYVTAIFPNNYPANEPSLYLNGVKQSLSLVKGTDRNTESATSTLYVSGFNGAYPFAGKIDDVKIYNRSLTDAEVMADYGGTCTPDCAGKTCGTDGCGSTCPPGCSGGQNCNAAGQCQVTALFTDDFESGNFNAWNNGPYRDGSGATPIDQSSVAYGGSYAAKFVIRKSSGEGASILINTVGSASTIMYLSAHCMFNDTSIAPGNFIYLGPCTDDADDSYDNAPLLYNDAGTIKWGMVYYDNSGGGVALNSSGPTISTNTWYNVEVMTSIGSGTGEAAAWINGQMVIHKTGLNNDDIGNLQDYQLGPYSDGTLTSPIAIYCDNAIMDTNYISQ